MYHVLFPIWYQFVPDPMDYNIYLLPPIFESHSLFLILNAHFYFLPSILNLITYSDLCNFFVFVITYFWALPPFLRPTVYFTCLRLFSISSLHFTSCNLLLSLTVQIWLSSPIFCLTASCFISLRRTYAFQRFSFAFFIFSCS